MTEITDRTIAGAAGVIFFDAECGACSSGAYRLERFLARRRFLFVPLQSPEAPALTHLSEAELRREMKLRLADGRVLGGPDALLHLARSVPWARPLAWLARTRFVRPMLHRTYARFARNRYRFSSACRIRRPDRLWIPSLVAIALLLFACAMRSVLTPSLEMWTIAAAIFSSLKLLTWWPIRLTATPFRTMAYFFACASLDAKRFFATSTTPARDDRATLPAIAHLAIGATFLWAIAPSISFNHPNLIASIGMIGIVLMLHFGLLQLLSIAWQRRGVDCPLVMNRPLSFVSLADFWSRWNRPFTALAYQTLFRPLRRVSVVSATMTTFLISGIVHDLAISFPAGGGFGGPTLYFLIQGGGIVLERALNLPRPYRRVFAAVVLVAPISLLFHATFIRNVVLPMMSAIGALGEELP
jgi:alginate O-acetyltransferase complex protein AlgI